MNKLYHGVNFHYILTGQVCSAVNRHANEEGGSFPQFAFHPDFAMMHFHNFSANCQPQASSGHFARHGAIYLAEFLKDHFLVLSPDADACVIDGK